MRRLVVLVTLIPLLLFPDAPALAASDLPLATPESVGMSSGRLDNIGKWLDRVIERGEAVGFVTLVARRGKVVHHEAHGNIGMSVNEPMPKDALFDLASMTKPVTVVAALMLLEEGRFLLTDPISKYLPEFEEQSPQREAAGSAGQRGHGAQPVHSHVGHRGELVAGGAL